MTSCFIRGSVIRYIHLTKADINEDLLLSISLESGSNSSIPSRSRRANRSRYDGEREIACLFNKHFTFDSHTNSIGRPLPPLCLRISSFGRESERQQRIPRTRKAPHISKRTYSTPLWALFSACLRIQTIEPCSGGSPNSANSPIPPLAPAHGTAERVGSTSFESSLNKHSKDNIARRICVIHHHRDLLLQPLRRDLNALRKGFQCVLVHTLILSEILVAQRRFPGRWRANEQNELRRTLVFLEERAEIDAGVRFDGLEVDVGFGRRKGERRRKRFLQKNGFRSVEGNPAVVGEIEIGQTLAVWI